MKITKSKLRRIIQEELNNVLHQEGMFDSISDAARGVKDYFIPSEREPSQLTGLEPELDAERVGGMSLEPDPDVDRSMTMGDAAADEYDDHIRDQEARQADYARHTGVDQQLRKSINAMRKAGEIDQATWRAARRALYKPGGVRKAKSIIKNARRAADPGFAGGYADLASNPAAAAYED